MNEVTTDKSLMTLGWSADAHIIDGELMPSWAYSAAAATLFLIGFFGFFCNLFVIVLMCKDKKLWTPMNIILFNLVCSDFSVSVLGNPLTLSAALAHRWIFGRFMCVIYGFFMALLGITSITTLTVLAFERYMMISRPFQSRHLSRESACVMVGGIWMYSLSLTVPPLFGWGEYVNEAANISCSVNWESKEISATSYIIFLFAMGLAVPVFVICFSYINIIRSLKQNTLRSGQVTKKESRVTYMVAAMIVAFLVAWTPYSVLALMIAFGDPSAVSPGLAVVPALVAKSSICYNPVIYVGLNTQFRSAWKRMMGVAPRTSETSQEIGPENTCISPPTMNNSHDCKPEAVRRDPKLLVALMDKMTSKSEEGNKTLEPFLRGQSGPENVQVEATEMDEMTRKVPIKLSRLVSKKANGDVKIKTKVIPDVWKKKAKKGQRVKVKMSIAETQINVEPEEIEVSQIATVTVGNVEGELKG